MKTIVRFVAGIVCWVAPLMAGAQHIRYRVESYKLEGALSKDLSVSMNLDSAGLLRGEMRIAESANGQTLFLGKFRNGFLADTAFRYDVGGVKAEVIQCGEAPDRSRYMVSVPCGKTNIRLPGMRNGITTVWNKVGDVPYLFTEERYVNHRQQGVTRGFYPGGQPLYEIMYDSIPDGYLKEWYQNGVLKTEGEYLDDEKTGRWKYYRPDGKLMEYHSCYGCKVDSAMKYDAAGNPEWEALMSDGKEHGYFKTYYPGGKLKSYIVYWNGYPTGKSIAYDENGNIKSTARYIDGHLNGIAETFYQNGQKFESVTYVYDDKTGPYTKWYPDGKIMETGNYYRNTQVGVWRYYDEAGKAVRRVYPDATGPNEPVSIEHAPPVRKMFLHRDDEPGETIRPTLPANRYMTESLLVTKENGLHFIKRYGEIKLLATITADGILQYRLITPVTNKKHLALIKNLLNSSRWTPAQINGSQAHAEVVLCLQWED